MSYDPGQPNKIRTLGGGVFVQTSWRKGEESEYQQNLNVYPTGDCDCPDFRNRKLPAHVCEGLPLMPCKHLKLAWQYVEQLGEVPQGRINQFKSYIEEVEALVESL